MQSSGTGYLCRRTPDGQHSGRVTVSERTDTEIRTEMHIDTEILQHSALALMCERRAFISVLPEAEIDGCTVFEEAFVLRTLPQRCKWSFRQMTGTNSLSASLSITPTARQKSAALTTRAACLASHSSTSHRHPSRFSGWTSKAPRNTSATSQDAHRQSEDIYELSPCRFYYVYPCTYNDRNNLSASSFACTRYILIVALLHRATAQVTERPDPPPPPRILPRIHHARAALLF